MEHMPNALTLLVLFLIAGAVGAAWTIIPALLKARYGTNEIITTLMMSFIGIDLANILIKGPFQDPTVATPRRASLPFDKLLPNDPGHAASTSACSSRFAAIFVVHFLLTRTSFGLRLQILGANPRAAQAHGRRRAAADRRQLPASPAP